MHFNLNKKNISLFNRISIKANSAALNYRPDIDGLRAIAVTLVVIFHFFPDFLKSGFIGVDIFFVISGYLISKNILFDLNKNTFNFFEFYARRIRRIFPSLILILIFNFIFGWFYLLSDEFKLLGIQIAGGASFISNFLLLKESGYFETPAASMPLLHLWSLAIEEQFYILWPIILWASSYCKIRSMALIIILAITSFVLNLQELDLSIAAGFYLPQARFWEILIGAILAFKIDRSFFGITNLSFKKSTIDSLALMGMATISISACTIPVKASFPGWWAILPIAGTALVIISGKEAWINRVFLSNPILVCIGIISFPIYLWHWPLLVYTKILYGHTPSHAIRVAIILISILLAFLTYTVIERPLRFGMNKNIKTMILILLMIVVGTIGFSTYEEKGFPLRSYQKKFDRYTSSIRRSELLSQCIDISHAYDKDGNWFCTVGDSNSHHLDYFAFGDSHVSSLIPAFEKFAGENNLSIAIAGASGCPALLGIQSMRGAAATQEYNCEKLNSRIFDYVKSNRIPNVILVGRWTYYTGGLTRPEEFNIISKDPDKATSRQTSKNDFSWSLKNTVEKFNDIGVNVYIIEDNPQQIIGPNEALRASGHQSDQSLNKYSVPYHAHVLDQTHTNNIIYSQHAHIISFNNILCKGENCPIVNDGKFIYFDGNHLTVDGALLVYPELSRQLLSRP